MEKSIRIPPSSMWIDSYFKSFEFRLQLCCRDADSYVWPVPFKQKRTSSRLCCFNNSAWIRVSIAIITTNNTKLGPHIKQKDQIQVQTQVHIVFRRNSLQRGQWDGKKNEWEWRMWKANAYTTKSKHSISVMISMIGCNCFAVIYDAYFIYSQ